MDYRIDFKNPEHVLKALLLLYGYQTLDEQVSESTHEDNDVGFNATDAGFCTSVAKQILGGRAASSKQIELLSSILRKYIKQVEANGWERVQLPKTALANFDGKKKYDGILGVQDGMLIFTPNIYPTSQVKQLGMEWKGEIKAWTGKADFSKAKGIQRLFPNIAADSTFVEWAKQFDLSNADSIITNAPVFDYQKEAAVFLVNAKRGLLGLAPGLGKSAVAAIAAKAAKAKRILVVCPLTLMRNWRNEIRKWNGAEAVLWHGGHEGWPKAKEGWAIANYDTVVAEADLLGQLKFDTIIIDESILVKNHSRVEIDGSWKNFKTLRVQAVYDITRDAERVWLLSGAPTSRFFDDLWTQLHIIDDKRFSSYWRFAETYCYIERNKWAKVIIANKEDAADRIKRDTADIFFARTQDQVLDLPDWIMETSEIEMDGEQERLYSRMETDFITDLPPDGTELVAQNQLVQLTRLIQLASNPGLLTEAIYSSPKWAAIEEALEYVQKPVIVWTTFIRTAQRMVEMLEKKDFRVAALTGSTKEYDRQTIVDLFQSGKLDAIVAHPGVGKFGLTLTAARTALYLERSFNGDDYYQSLHRIRRIGTKYSPHVIHYLSVKKDGSGTVDHVIDQVLDYRTNSSISLTSGILRELFDGIKRLH